MRNKDLLVRLAWFFRRTYFNKVLITLICLFSIPVLASPDILHMTVGRIIFIGGIFLIVLALLVKWVDSNFYRPYVFFDNEYHRVTNINMYKYSDQKPICDKCCRKEKCSAMERYIIECDMFKEV